MHDRKDKVNNKTTRIKAWHWKPQHPTTRARRRRRRRKSSDSDKYSQVQVKKTKVWPSSYDAFIEMWRDTVQKKEALIKEDRRRYKFGSQEYLIVECLHNDEENGDNKREKKQGDGFQEEKERTCLLCGMGFLCILE